MIIEKYDLPLLRCEFARAGVADFGREACIIDVMMIFKKHVRWNLTGAVLFYLQRSHSQAHSAAADAQATAEILLQQIECHDIPNDVERLQAYCRAKPDHCIDQEGKFVWRDNQATIHFGKWQGQTLAWMAEHEHGYLEWILGGTFADELKGIVKEVLAGSLPIQSPKHVSSYCRMRWRRYTPRAGLRVPRLNRGRVVRLSLRGPREVRPR